MRTYLGALIFALLTLSGETIMAEPDKLVLQPTIEPDRVLKTIDLYSEEKSLGSGGLQRIMEGEVTIGLPTVDHAVGGTPKNSPVKWDYYSVSMPFTLHRLDGDRYYESAVFQVTLKDPLSTCVDLFPAHVKEEIKISRTLSISPEFKFDFKLVGVEIKGGETGRSLDYIVLMPVVTSFGKGQNQFYWEYKPFKEQSVFPGDKQAAVILRVPRGLQRIDADLEYEAVIVEKVFGMYKKRNSKTGKFPVVWTLPKPINSR